MWVENFINGLPDKRDGRWVERFAEIITTYILTVEYLVRTCTFEERRK